jgi:hypothetical protein
VIEEPARSAPQRPLSPRALAAVVLCAAAAAFAASVVKVYDTDMFHHLAMGRHIARNGFAPAEPFLFPFQGAPEGPPPYWLGSLAIYGWHLLAGDGGLPYLPALVGGALAVVLVLDSSPRRSRPTLLSLAAAALPLVLAVEAFRYRAVARPELFATFLVALVLWAVRRFEDGAPRLLYAFPLLALLWTNVHMSVLAGVVAVLALPACGALELAVRRLRRGPAPGAPSRRSLAIAAALGLAGLAAGLANPSPASPIRLSLALLSRAAARLVQPAAAPGGGSVDAVVRGVREMRPPSAHFFVEPFGLLLALTAVALLLRWRSVRLREVATVALFAALTASGARFAVLLAVACAPIAARSLGEALAAAPEGAGVRRPRALGTAACLVAALAATPIAATEPMLCAGTGFRPGSYPSRGASYLEQLGFRGRLFNSFHFGGYLSWRGVGPPYQDGRGMLHPGEERAAMLGPLDRHAFRDLDRKYRFDALLVAYPDEEPASTAMLGAMFGNADWAADRSTWSLVAFDDGGLLYLRRDGAYAERAARDEYRSAVPATATFSPAPDQLLPLLADFRRSVGESPDCGLCRYYHAVAALSVGLVDEARASIARMGDPSCMAHRLHLDAARAAVEEAGRPPR